MCYDDAQVRRIIKLMDAPFCPLTWTLALRLVEVMQKPLSSKQRRIILSKIYATLESSTEAYKAA